MDKETYDGKEYRDDKFVEAVLNVMTDYCIQNSTTSVPESVINRLLASRGLNVNSKEFRRLLINGPLTVLEIHYSLISLDDRMKMRKYILEHPNEMIEAVPEKPVKVETHKPTIVKNVIKQLYVENNNKQLTLDSVYEALHKKDIDFDEAERILRRLNNAGEIIFPMSGFVIPSSVIMK